MTATATTHARTDITTDEPLSRARASALVAAPVLLVLGSAVHPAESSDAKVMLQNVAQAQTQWWVSHVLLMLGAGLLIAGIHTLLQHTDRSAPKLSRLGAACAGVGAAAVLAVIATESIATWALSRSTELPAASTALDDVYGATELLFIPFVLAFHVGLVLLALALRRTPGTPAFAPIALIAGSVLLLGGNIVLSPWLCAAAGVLIAAAIVPVGLQARRGRTP